MIFVGSPWQGQSPTRPDPTTYRHADGGDYAQLVYEINTRTVGTITLALTIDDSSGPGTPVYLESTGHVAAAKANSLATTNVLGLVNNQGLIQVSGTLTLATGQWDALTGQSGGLVVGTWYWLSDTTTGRLVNVEPEVLGHYSVAVLYALSTTEALILVNAPDFVVESLFARCNDFLSVIDIVSINHVTLLSLSEVLTISDLVAGIRQHDFVTASDTLTITDAAVGIDVPPSFIYFEDAATQLISKSNADGSSITVICTNPQDTVVSVGADPTNDLVFWIDTGSTARLGLSRLGEMRLGTEGHSLKYVPFSGGTSNFSVSAVPSAPTGFAVDPNWLYQYGTAGLWLTQYNTDGSAAAGLGNPYIPIGIPGGLAIDRIHSFAGHSPIVYLADNVLIKASVNYANLASLNGNTTIYTPGGTLGQIACDDINGYLFVMDGFLLRRMDLNGGAPTTVLNVGSTVNALFVDKNLQKVYYEYGNKVVQSNYDGSSPVTVLTSVDTLNANSGYGIAP